MKGDGSVSKHSGWAHWIVCVPLVVTDVSVVTTAKVTGLGLQLAMLELVRFSRVVDGVLCRIMSTGGLRCSFTVRT